mgnify:CR=1 FL=1
MSGKHRSSDDGLSNDVGDRSFWIDSLSEERYGAKEKTTVRKVMIPVSNIIKLWKRIFK